LKSFVVAIACVLSSLAFGQSTVFNQADIYVDKTAEIHVFGDFVNDGTDASLEHHGFIQTYNDLTDGNFELQNISTVTSDGDYMIQNDWINNGILQIDSGLVDMYGDNQWFRGDSVSSFWNLDLTGTDIKEQEQDIRVQSVLNINNHELAVHDQILYIDSSDAAVILFDNTFLNEGIISTDEDGQIRKYLLNGDLTVIPTGSSQGAFKRHRPIKVTLKNAAQDTAYVTFHHHTPDLVNAFEVDMDTSLCKIQTEYFYTFNSAVSANRYQLDLAHYPTQDGFYPDVAQWENPTWKMVYNHSDYQDVNYSYAVALDEGDFVNEHYTLGYQTPVAPYLLFDSTECYTWATYAVEQPLNQPWNEWTVTNSDETAIITDGQGTSQIDVNWMDNIGGWIYNQYIDTAGCWSHIDSAQIFDVSIQADFSFTNDYASDFGTSFTFYNESSGATDEISWIIEDQTDWISDPDMSLPYFHEFETDGEITNYDTYLIAHNIEHDCYDTAYQLVTVPSIFVFYAPNAFTPDGDGFNETFFAYTSRTNLVKLDIFNRWGELIYTGEALTAEDLVWDGTYKGEVVQSGTYTYKYIIWPQNYNEGEQSAFEYTGHVSVLR